MENVNPYLVSLYDFESQAKQNLPGDIWDFIDAGAFDEITSRRNRSALDSIALRPRFLRGIRDIDISTTVLGTPISFPVIIAPAAGHCIAHPDGELATALGASKSNTLMVAATNSDYSMEEISKTTSAPKWFQLYHRNQPATEILVRRAQESGYQAICLTIDTPVPSAKERDVRNRFQGPFKNGNFIGMDVPNVQEETPNWMNLDRPNLTWKDIEWLRKLTALPLILKGIRTAEDAKLAVDHDVDGIFVSNHGGRQIDMTLSSIETLQEINEAVNGKLEIYLDSGIRRGSDVLKALALGARAVAIGRPLFWGLSVEGAEGVHRILEILSEELTRAMAYCGQGSVTNLEQGILSIPGDWATRTVL